MLVGGAARGESRSRRARVGVDALEEEQEDKSEQGEHRSEPRAAAQRLEARGWRQSPRHARLARPAALSLRGAVPESVLVRARWRCTWNFERRGHACRRDVGRAREPRAGGARRSCRPASTSTLSSFSCVCELRADAAQPLPARVQAADKTLLFLNLSLARRQRAQEAALRRENLRAGG